MGFLGGLAGTLNKVIGQNAEIQRSEEATIRSEDRAAMRKFNADNNEEMIDGVLHHVLRGKDGNIIASRAFTETEIADREAGKIERRAKTVGYQDTLNKDALYKEWSLKNPGKTKEDWEAEVGNARGLTDFENRAKITDKYRAIGDSREHGYNMREAAARRSSGGGGGLSGYASTVKAISAGILNGSLDVSSSKYTSGQARQIAAGAQKGIKGYATLLDNLISGRDTKIKKVGTSSGAAAGSDAEADPF